jgi:hypothetical protein
MPRKWLYVVLGLAFLFVLMPYLLWQETWFGRPLNDTQMAKAFTNYVRPREAQHALSQVADRILSPNASVRASARKWYPQVLALAASPSDELRLTSAWVMGQDNTELRFHEALVRLLGDPNPVVQRNAAVQLVRFNDPAGHDIIVSMLRPYVMPSPAAGKLAERLTPGDVVNPGTMVGRIEPAGGGKVEVRTKVPGTLEQWIVPDGAIVAPGQLILRLDPSSDMAWEALRALYLIGKPEDAGAIFPFAHGVAGMPANVATQAAATLQAIRSRAPAS